MQWLVGSGAATVAPAAERAIAYRASAVQHVPAVNAQEMGRRWL